MDDNKDNQSTKLTKLVNDIDFYEILNEIEYSHVPPKYIGIIRLYYDDNTELDIEGDTLDQAIDVDAIKTCDNPDTGAKVLEAKVYINVQKLETDVIVSVDKLLRNWCR